MLGSNYSLNAVMAEMISQKDFRKSAHELKIPVYFLEGRHDYNVPSVLAEKYFNALKAPKKEFIWFETQRP